MELSKYDNGYHFNEKLGWPVKFVYIGGDNWRFRLLKQMELFDYYYRRFSDANLLHELEDVRIGGDGSFKIPDNVAVMAEIVWKNARRLNVKDSDYIKAICYNWTMMFTFLTHNREQVNKLYSGINLSCAIYQVIAMVHTKQKITNPSFFFCYCAEWLSNHKGLILDYEEKKGHRFCVEAVIKALAESISTVLNS